MKDRIFIDTNIFVYSAVADSNHTDRRQKAIELIQDEDCEIVISTQVLNELSVILIKNGIDDEAIRERVTDVYAGFPQCPDQAINSFGNNNRHLNIYPLFY